MTTLNFISIGILIVVIVAAIFVYRHFRRLDEDVDGLGDLNERGKPGTSKEGDIISDI